MTLWPNAVHEPSRMSELPGVCAAPGAGLWFDGRSTGTAGEAISQGAWQVEAPAQTQVS